MKENYTYPVLVDRSDSGFINIIFPGFDGGNPEIPVMTCVEAGEDFIAAAQDELALTIDDYEKSGRELPPEDMTVCPEEGQQLIYLNLWMPYHRSRIKVTYVKKTLTVPTWLDLLAKEKNINYSAVLTAGLKEELGISHTPSDRDK